MNITLIRAFYSIDMMDMMIETFWYKSEYVSNILVSPACPVISVIKERKAAKIRIRYNQVPNLTQDTT